MHSFGISYFVHWPLAYPCTYSAVHIHVGGAIQCTVHTPPSDVQCVRHLSAMGGLVYTFRNPAHAVIGARLSLLGSARRGAWVEVHLYGQPTSTKYYHSGRCMRFYRCVHGIPVRWWRDRAMTRGHAEMHGDARGTLPLAFLTLCNGLRVVLRVKRE